MFILHFANVLDGGCMSSFVIGTFEQKQIGQVYQGLLDENNVLNKEKRFIVIQESDEMDWFTSLMATNEKPEAVRAICLEHFVHFYRVHLVKSYHSIQW